MTPNDSSPRPDEADTGPSDADLDEAVPQTSGGREVRVGIFVLVGIVSFLAVLYLTTDPALFRGRYIVSTTVDHAGGMRVGDPVQMRGVNIGRVQGFSLARDSVQISLEIEGEWEIPQDSHTRITGIGLLGGRVVEVVRGSSPEMLESGEDIPGASTEDVTEEVTALSGEARSTMQRIQALLSEPTVSAVRGSARELDALLQEIRTFTEAQRSRVDSLTASLNRSARGLEEVADAGPEAARAIARADSALVRLNQTGASLEDAAASLDRILARLDRGEGTLGQLARNDSLYQNLNRAAESIHQLATDLRENPGRYVTVEIF